MAILVVDPGGASVTLVDVLRRRGFAVTPMAEASEMTPRTVRRDEGGHYELVLCACSSSTSGPMPLVENVADRCPGIPIALVLHDIPSADSLLEAMRLGVVDVLDARVPVTAQADAVAEVLDRLAHQRSHRNALSASAADADGFSATSQQLRTEAQLRELQRDQRAGRYIQMGMLPPSPMAVDGYRLRHKIFPSLMLSGDFVDYFRVTDQHFAFYMADVSGHGASSAFVTVLLKNFSRRLRREYTPRMLTAPGDILVWLNRELLDNQLDKHVAIFIGIVDLAANELMFANAGHYPSAVLIDDQHGARLLELIGKPVGLFRDVSYESRQQCLAPGCSLFLVSDGVLEAMGDGRLAEREQQLLEAATQAHQGVDEIWQILDLAKHESNPDDMACLTLSREL
jgi:phosphoserine phosphatase RsbU/P